MNKKNKKIEFYPVNKIFKDVAIYPEPAANALPSWYKKQSPAVPNVSLNNPIINLNGGVVTGLTIKRCVPVRDAMASGYILSTFCDISVTRQSEEHINFSTLFDEELRIVSAHPIEQYLNFPIPENYDPVAYKWASPFFIKTPPGYSTLFISPINHDLPFWCIPGIVDTDKHIVPANFPFFIKKDFQGIIERGTPMVQVIPFKRENWTSINKKEIFDEFSGINKMRTKLSGYYRDYVWSKKEFK